MYSAFSSESLIKSLKTNSFLLHSNMPMGYVPGLPILCILNGNLCMKVPFLKYKVTGEVDHTFVYPVRFVATVLIPEGVIASFEDLSLNPAFAQVAFSEPAGTFRHEAIKALNKPAYENMRSSLYQEYDKIVNSLILGKEYPASDEAVFKKLLNTLLEPCLRPFYRVIDPFFSNKYLTR